MNKLNTMNSKRVYVKAESMATGPLVRADLIAKGYDGTCYMVTSKAGALGTAYKSGETYYIINEM